MARRRVKKGWSPGDLDYPVNLTKQPRGTGRWLYISQEHLSLAVNGTIDGKLPERLYATRTVLQDGSGQILLRVKTHEQLKETAAKRKVGSDEDRERKAAEDTEDAIRDAEDRREVPREGEP